MRFTSKRFHELTNEIYKFFKVEYPPAACEIRDCLLACHRNDDFDGILAVLSRINEGAMKLAHAKVESGCPLSEIQEIGLARLTAYFGIITIRYVRRRQEVLGSN